MTFDGLFSEIQGHLTSYTKKDTQKEALVFYMNMSGKRFTTNERILVGGDTIDVLPSRVYIKPNAVFALGIALFFFTAVLIWYCCMKDIDGAYYFNKTKLPVGDDKK
jgi:hypothetical protein